MKLISSMRAAILATPEQQAQGLAGLEALPADVDCWAFPIDPPRRMGFDFTGMCLDLDLIEIGPDGKVAAIHREIAPGGRLVTSEVGIVLELRGGDAERFGIRLGQHLSATEMPA